MLLEIRCNKFRQGPILFHERLNVVIGDGNGTNSIGKSTLLMIIDFTFGGESFLKHNTDVVAELGHHYYDFAFEFGGVQHKFRRGTEHPDDVLACSDNYVPTKSIGIAEYNSWLKASYLQEESGISFRGMVSLFSRIWGKDNLHVSKPLHAVQNQRASECVETILKIFGEFEKIAALAAEEKEKDVALKALSKAFSTKLLDKISKKTYLQNEINIDGIASEIQDIKSNLARYALNINELVNRDVIELKERKDAVLTQKLSIDEKLSRVRRNISNNRHLRSKNLASLIDFFPDVNSDRIANIEEFHSKVATLLKRELVAEEKELAQQSLDLHSELSRLDASISAKLVALDNPSAIVDRIYDLSKQWQKFKGENDYFQRHELLGAEIRALKEQIKQLKEVALGDIEAKINTEIRQIVTRIYGEVRQSPALDLKENNYSYHVFEDTGTGKAYSNLIVFDLAIFELTELPILIHDSLLYKNVENNAVAGIISEYASSRKQSFIAIDEISKYGVIAEKQLKNAKVIELSDANVLYIKDWRRKEKA
jgi:hypothetical protein